MEQGDNAVASERPRVSDAAGVVRIANERLDLGFDTRRCGALISLADPITGWQFVRHQESTGILFRLALRRQADEELEWYDSQEAAQFTWEAQEEEEGSITLHMVARGFRRAGLAVHVNVTLRAGSPLSTWHLQVEGTADAAVYQAVYPVIGGVLKPGGGVPGEVLAVPRQGEGYLFHNPYPVVDNLPLKAGAGPEAPAIGVGEIHGRYPGSFAMQLLLYYTETAGLYLACHDAGQNVKEFDVAPDPHGSDAPVMSIAHFPEETTGADAGFTYETVVGVFHGDWYDGADIYKAWARQQWWCVKTQWEKDLAPWIRGGAGVFQMQNYDIPVLTLTHPLAEIADTVNAISREAGVPLLALMFNFEHDGAWTGPKGFFPPREGDRAFRQAMISLREAGNLGFVYIPGGNWYIAISSYDPPFDSWPEFEAEGRAMALMDPDGTVAIQSYYPGWQGSRLCPHTDYVRQLTADLLLGCIDRGCSVVQIDNFPIQNAAPCYNPAHGHPRGNGPWWAQSWCRILAEVREKARAKDPQATIATEGISEMFIPWIDLFDQRAGNMEYFGHCRPGDPAGGEVIPLFNYVYSGYIGAYCAAYPECSRPEVLYWARCFGKSLTQGVVPTGGWHLPEQKALNPVTMAFFHKVVRAAVQDCWMYIMFGEMLKPPHIEVPEIEFSYVRWLDLTDLPQRHPEVRHVVKDRAVQVGSFRAMDGTLGHILVNVSLEPVEFEVELPSYGSTTQGFTVQGVFDGERRQLHQRLGLPGRLPLRIEPLSVVLLEVREAAP